MQLTIKPPYTQEDKLGSLGAQPLSHETLHPNAPTAYYTLNSGT